MLTNNLIKRYLVFGILLMFILPVAIAQDTNDLEDPGITPDSILWGLDKAIEQFTLALTFDNIKKAKLHVKFANERLQEVKLMIEQNKLEAAEKAKNSHGRSMRRARLKVEALENEDSLEEIEEVVEIEKELENHDDEIDQVFDGLKVKIKIRGELTQEQKDLIDSFLESFKGQTGELEIEIKNKKNKIKIKIKQKTGKSDEEIETEIEGIEEGKGLRKEQRASERIEDAEKRINKLKEKIGAPTTTNDTPTNDTGTNGTDTNDTMPEPTTTPPVVSRLLERAESKLQNAKQAFDEGVFGRAFGQANAAERLARNALRRLERRADRDDEDDEDEREIEVKIKDGKAEIKIEVGDEKLEFELETTDLEAIIDEISARTGLTAEEINAILKLEVEDDDDDNNDNNESDTNNTS